MGRRCCINGCNSNSRLAEHCGVTFHSFPLDATIRALWIRNTRLSGDRQITKSVLVCSRHFRRVDFQPQRTGKFLLRQRVFPTVFPWGKIDTAQIDSDLMTLKTVGDVSSPQASSSVSASTSAEDATVQATVAQIMAETAELNAAAAAVGKSPAAAATVISNKNTASDFAAAVVGAAVDTHGTGSSPLTTMPKGGIKFGPLSTFTTGTRLEAQDFDGMWHFARIVEVDNDDRELLIKFENRRIGKNKSNVDGPEEWIPMNSTRLRQKVATKDVPIFKLDEKCMARWTGPRKFPGTVQKLLGNGSYEVLFDDGYIKDVRAVHMQKVNSLDSETASQSSPSADVSPVSAKSLLENPTAAAASLKLPKNASASGSGSSNSKKRSAPGPRKDWPLLDMSKLDLTTLNLPAIPHDGEWTCHWVNDQPIGREGFLIVGEHRKPTVIVEDWRLPPGWVKHMYQRSNVLGKWDVILVTPSNKRFRSKADLKVFLEEQGIVYNPDIYDFSIHRRRAKDINAYVYTADYTPQQTPKPRPLATSLDLLTPNNSKSAGVTPLAVGASQFIDTPVASAELPMELMTPTSSRSTNAAQTSAALSFATDSAGVAYPPADTSFAFIGGLKVDIVDNLFRCPQEGCSKNFRKENHLQIHVKHYHHHLVKLLGECPKMLDLAEKRTHPVRGESAEPVPKNQIPNQQFFAKLHQQDLEHARTHRRSGRGSTTPEIDAKETPKRAQSSTPTDRPEAAVAAGVPSPNDSTTGGSSMLDSKVVSSVANDSISALESIPAPAPLVSSVKRARFTPSKRTFGSRKSSRQRTTRLYLTAVQARMGSRLPRMITADSSFGASDFEETRHSFNATPDAKPAEARRRKPMAAPSTPLSSSESPMTADSGSSTFQPLQAPPAGNSSGRVMQKQTHYIKDNGDIGKIVSMRQEEIINCLCSYGEEDGLMIQCELCLCWQHGACNGIEKEEEVPEKYVCYICRHPQRQRESLRFKHDQEWLYEGKLPVANYHSVNPNLSKRSEFLKNSHTLTGNLIELRQFVESLRVKVNIANNRSHPKLYLWAKKWEEETAKTTQLGKDDTDKSLAVNVKLEGEVLPDEKSPSKRARLEVEPETLPPSVPNVPQPEAPIDPVECQQRLLEHINVQQHLVSARLAKIEKEIEELEKGDDIANTRDIDMNTMKEVIALFIRDLEALQKIANLNEAANVKLEQQSNNASN